MNTVTAMKKPVYREEGQPLFSQGKSLLQTLLKTLLCKAFWLEMEEVVEVNVGNVCGGGGWGSLASEVTADLQFCRFIIL